MLLSAAPCRVTATVTVSVPDCAPRHPCEAAITV